MSDREENDSATGNSVQAGHLFFQKITVWCCFQTDSTGAFLWDGYIYCDASPRKCECIFYKLSILIPSCCDLAINSFFIFPNHRYTTSIQYQYFSYHVIRESIDLIRCWRKCETQRHFTCVKKHNKTVICEKQTVLQKKRKW